MVRTVFASLHGVSVNCLSAACLMQGLLALGDYMNVQCHACIGGTNVGEDIRKLDYGQHVVAGTPGRVFGKEFNGSLFQVLLHTRDVLKLFHMSFVLQLVQPVET